MCPFVKPEVPFEYSNKVEFPSKLVQWIGDVFYDILPEHGYEVREEQVYTAYQLAEAVCRQRVHLAEAGLGTGKTFAYLLTALSYARFTGKPAVIACASTALQEQLAGPGGDIETLSRLLGLEIDARMAKDPRQYICDVRLDGMISPFMERPDTALNDVIDWAGETKRGERSEVPQVPDRVWQQLAWDETMHCEVCSSRGFCKLVKAREHYRPARDIIVGDHGIFFDDLWSRDERIADGRLTLLPEYSVVIFDEGHEVLLPAAMRAGSQMVREHLDDMVFSLEQLQGARISLVVATAGLGGSTARFFNTLQQSAIQDERTSRLAVQVTDGLLEAAQSLRRALDALDFQLQSEQEMHTEAISSAELQSFESRIEGAARTLHRFCTNGGLDTIVWIDGADGSFWVVPRDLRGLFNKHLFAKKIPVVFSSATLSSGGDFSYFAGTLGLTEPSTSSVGSSFELEKQVVVYLPNSLAIMGEPLDLSGGAPDQSSNLQGRTSTHGEQPALPRGIMAPNGEPTGLPGEQDDWFSLALGQLVSLLKISGGRALVLTNSPSDVRRIREGLKDYQLPFDFLWEDSGERGYLVRRFRQEVSSVLVGSGFWEGIDVPGEALSLLVIWRLPFPPVEPLIEARRLEVQEQGLDPIKYVDYPEMGLKLKQGCGRLIRSSDDRGVIAILEPVLGRPWEQVALEALPPGAQTVGDVSPFLNSLFLKSFS